MGGLWTLDLDDPQVFQDQRTVVYVAVMLQNADVGNVIFWCIEIKR